MNLHASETTFDAAVGAVRAAWPGARPRCGIVLGSGWGEAVAGLRGPELPYAQIPGLGTTGVAGHAGRLRRATLGGMELFLFLGRRHWYEGEGWTPVALPAYLLHAFGAGTILLTNAAGGIRADLAPGTLMAIADHINLLGGSPLAGPHNPRLGPRFPDQTEVYAKPLREKLRTAGADAEGTYLATAGPSFETPAEIRHFRAIGADAVGMSTVPEAIVANALGLAVAGLSCISNRAAGLGAERLLHEDVARVAAASLPRMQRVLANLLETLAAA